LSHRWIVLGAGAGFFGLAILTYNALEEELLPDEDKGRLLIFVSAPEGSTIEYTDRMVREVETMHGSTGHSEIVIEDLRVPAENMLGGRGQGHQLGQYRLGPARLAHCMRWIAQAETALDMMVDRSLNRYAHGSLLAEKQGIQWMIADSAMELYQAKLMVLHAAYRIDQKLDFKSEVSMAKHFVANALNRIVDRAVQDQGETGRVLVGHHA
jgi:acyl-CoA dehydrogenase